MAAGAIILLATMQGGGTVPPTMAVARRLVEHGHRVHVLSEPTVAAEAAAAGCSFTVWPTAPFADVTNRDRTTGRDWEVRTPAQVLRLVRDLTDFIFGAAGRYAADLLTTLDQVPADAVVLDPMILGALTGAERSGLPTAGLVPNIYLRPTPGRPVLGSGWLPGDGPLVRIRDRVAPAVFERVVDLGLRRLNAVRAGLGLAPLRHVFDAFDRCTRVLVMTSPSFDPPPARLPPNVRFVGPMLDDPAWAAPVSLPPGDDPLVLVAMSSTYQAQQAVLNRAVRALAGLPVRGLVTLGPSLRAGEVAGAPNVAVVPSAPHAQIMRTAAAVVTHGGHGTVIKALAAGVPLVCLPHGRDQGDNAARVVAAGAGLRLSRRADAATIRAAVRRVLEEQAFSGHADTLAHRIAVELRETSAVGEIEQLLDRRGQD
jgi:UDP:flavonoid glycosyltransferase YjiC (YdhE family)